MPIKSKNKKQRTMLTISSNQELNKRLRIAKDKTGVPVSVLVRKGIKSILRSIEERY